MIFKIESVSELENVKLVMFERTMLPESIRETVEGKTVFKKTGKEVENTTYTFLDESGDKLVFLSPNSELRDKEGETGALFVDLGHDSYKKKNTVKLVGFLD